MKSRPKVYILILNWNGWQDTIECLESVFRNTYPNYQVVVLDNASENDSVTKIKEWAEGKRELEGDHTNPLYYFTYPPVKKPVPYIEYDRRTAETGGCTEMEKMLYARLPDSITHPLVLIQTGSNLGFAGGNNVGLRYALSRDDFDYVWLLNNDTVIKPDALIHLVNRMQEKPDAGMCGSTLLYYHEPDKVQALGGAVYNKWLAVAKHIGLFQSVNDPIDVQKVEHNMNYVVGASMLVSKQFLRDIGLMSEDYFLYYEEIDWAVRARGRYTLAYAPDSVVYHKEGGSIGSSGKPKEKSWTADYYGIKNRLVFTRKYFPWALFTVYLGLGVAIINRIRRKQWKRVKMILEIMLSNYSCKLKTFNNGGK